MTYTSPRLAAFRLPGPAVSAAPARRVGRRAGAADASCRRLRAAQAPLIAVPATTGPGPAMTGPGPAMTGPGPGRLARWHRPPGGSGPDPHRHVRTHVGSAQRARPALIPIRPPPRPALKTPPRALRKLGGSDCISAGRPPPPPHLQRTPGSRAEGRQLQESPTLPFLRLRRTPPPIADSLPPPASAA